MMMLDDYYDDALWWWWRINTMTNDYDGEWCQAAVIVKSTKMRGLVLIVRYYAMVPGSQIRIRSEETK